MHCRSQISEKQERERRDEGKYDSSKVERAGKKEAGIIDF